MHDMPSRIASIDHPFLNQSVAAHTSDGGLMTSRPPMNGCSASGTVTLPSASWKFSRIATTRRGTAAAVAFSVCTYCVATFLGLPPPFFLPPFAGLPLLPLAAALESASAGGGAGRKRMLRGTHQSLGLRCLYAKHFRQIDMHDHGFCMGPSVLTPACEPGSLCSCWLS